MLNPVVSIICGVVLLISTSNGFMYQPCNNVTGLTFRQYTSFSFEQGPTVTRWRTVPHTLIRYNNDTSTETLILNYTIADEYRGRVAYYRDRIVMAPYKTSPHQSIYIGIFDNGIQCVYVIDKTYYRSHRRLLLVTVGSPLHLRCKSSDDDSNIIIRASWIFVNHQNLLYDATSKTCNDSIYIDNVQLSDDGIFMCENENHEYYFYDVRVSLVAHQ